MIKLTDILSKLKDTIPPEYLKFKTKGGTRITFISWYGYCDLLDERCGLGNWSWEIKEASQVGNRTLVVGRLTIYGDDRQISFDSTGNEDLDRSGFGDALSCAESMALRRACAKAGLARELWDKEEQVNQTNQTNYSTKTQPVPYKANGKGEISREQWIAKFGGN